MNFGPDKLWLIPLFPLVAAGFLSVFGSRRSAAPIAIGALAISTLLSIAAFIATLGGKDRQVWNFDWVQTGTASIKLGFVLDPLGAIMLLMVTTVGLLVFIYSAGYMSDDPRFSQFFCFLSLFAAGMLGVLIANSLLFLFICWEIVGLASYLLIGFWYFKPSAAAAAQKAFITTRIGDIGLFLGMIWLYSRSGTLLFYDGGKGCLETRALENLVTNTTILGLAPATAIALLIFCGAAGKSGQVPLHVWLPDAMEGPTPVSALIHAATMVAAGVFLIARVYPLMDVDLINLPRTSTALAVITWVGAITAIFAALIACAQSDIKRILAYSTISQLGYMMAGLGMGGVAVGIFHLLAHAFFKALLFLGAGSVIHGSGGEQDIYKMGGLRKSMPVTFATYGIGMMALSGVPLFFSGFWSKDEILHSALIWPIAKGPFVLLLTAAFLTAFYMTRQMAYVFFGNPRGSAHPHESPQVMTLPLIMLAIVAICFGFFGTPAWPWVQNYLIGEAVGFHAGELFSGHFGLMLLISTLTVGLGIGAASYIYKRSVDIAVPDPVEARIPVLFKTLREKFYIDEFYEQTIIALTRWLARSAAVLENGFFDAIGWVAGNFCVAGGWLSRLTDQFILNLGFDQSCAALRKSAAEAGSWQNGKVQNYLRAIAVTVLVLVLFLAWGWKGLKAG
jgi:NADH-quinone oxidoreductase subunit L